MITGLFVVSQLGSSMEKKIIDLFVPLNVVAGMMTKQDAIKLLEQLIEANMSQGMIKNFAALDKLRQAIWVLQQPDQKDN